MNQQYGTSNSRFRGGRGHHQNAGPGRFHNQERRFPNPNYNRNMNYNHNNNNNSPKCFNQNVEHCTNPNMERAEFLVPNDRSFQNPNGNSQYGGNEPAAFPMQPMYHGARMIFDAPQFGQPQFGDMSAVPPHMLPQPMMQVVNFPPPAQPTYPMHPPNILYNTFYTHPHANIPPPPESFNPMKDDVSRSQSRESFMNEADLIECATSDFGVGQTQACANCMENSMQSTLTIHSLRVENERLVEQIRALQKEIASLKAERQAEVDKLKGGPASGDPNGDAGVVVKVEPDEKRGLSVNAAEFKTREAEGKPRAEILQINLVQTCPRDGQGVAREPDLVEAGYEKTCKDLIQFIASDDSWPNSSPDAPPPKPPPIEIPVVSAKWSEMIEAEASSDAISPTDHTSRGRVPPDATDVPRFRDGASGRGNSGRRLQPEQRRGPSNRGCPDNRGGVDNRGGASNRGGPDFFNNRGGTSNRGGPDYSDNRGGVDNRGGPSNRGGPDFSDNRGQHGPGIPGGHNRGIGVPGNLGGSRPVFTPSDRQINYPLSRGAPGFYANNRGGNGSSNRGRNDGRQNRSNQPRPAPEWKPPASQQLENWRAENGGLRCEARETAPSSAPVKLEGAGSVERRDSAAKPQADGEEAAEDWGSSDEPIITSRDKQRAELGRAVEKPDAGPGEAAEAREEKRDGSRDSRPQSRRSADGYHGGGSGDGSHGRSSFGASDARSRPTVITEIEGDLFTAAGTVSLAHCVAADLQMGSGIAVTFRDRFKRVDELLDQRKSVGEVAVLEDAGRYVYYMITKPRSQGKPSMGTLEASLRRTADHCRAAGVKRLAMPRVGCGLDRLNWTQVRRMIDDVFVGSGVEITVYNYPQYDERKDEVTPRKRTFWVTQTAMNLVDIEPNTGLVYICAEEEKATPTMLALDRKHNLMPSFRAAKRVCGEVVETIGSSKEVLYGLVVKKRLGDPLSYRHLMAALRKLRTKNNAACYEYFGIEAFRDGDDVLTMHKVFTLFRNVFGGGKFKLDVWGCFPEEFASDMDEQTSGLSTSGASKGETP